MTPILAFVEEAPMPIANYKPHTDPVIPVNLPKTEPANHRSIVYNDNHVPLSSLIAYVEGAPYYCDYFKQVVAEHNDLREIDPGQPNLYQQYEQIKRLEIRVSTALASSYDADTGITSVTGGGLIYPFMIPNVSDYFVSDADMHRKGLFRITNVERRTFNRDSAFYIDYEMVGYIDAVGPLYDDLMSKVIREYHFSKERLLEGLQPVLRTSQYEQLNTLHQRLDELAQYYLKTFFNKQYTTLVIPGQAAAIYDSFLVDFLMKVLDYSRYEEMRHLRQFCVDKDPFIQQSQFWELLLRRDFNGLASCNQKMSQVSKYTFSSSGFIHGIFFSNIDYIVYPVSPDLTALLTDNPEAKTVDLEVLEEPTNVFGTLAELILHQYVAGTQTYPYVKLVTEDDYYVLSEAFYTQSGTFSVLEILVKDYLKQQPINLDMLLALCDAYTALGRLEQYYYGPVLMLLIKEADRTNY